MSVVISFYQDTEFHRVLRHAQVIQLVSGRKGLVASSKLMHNLSLYNVHISSFCGPLLRPQSLGKVQIGICTADYCYDYHSVSIIEYYYCSVDARFRALLPPPPTPSGTNKNLGGMKIRHLLSELGIYALNR